MKRLIAIMTILFMMTGQIFADELDLVDESTFDESLRALEQFNALREKVLIIPPITADERLKVMAKVHSIYMAHNDVLSSVEDSDNEYYRGRYPWDRASYHKYTSDYVYEFVMKDLVSYSEGFDRLMADPISRNIIFNPLYTDIGISGEEDYFTFVFGGEERSSTRYVRYPSQNQTSVPVSWEGDSLKDQLGDFYREDRPVGMPITISYYGNELLNFQDYNIQLINTEDNTTIETLIVKPGDHYLLSNTLTIVPVEPLAYETKYQVQVRFSFDIESNGILQSRPYENIYSFTTENEVEQVIKSPYLTRREFTEALVRLQGYPLVEPLELRFSDVDINSKAATFIYTANKEGLINGFPDGRFGPELNITKEQAITILVKAYEKNHDQLTLTDNNDLHPYVNRDNISDWALSYVVKAATLGFLTQDFNDVQSSNSYLTEMEFQAMIDAFTTAVKDN